MTVAADKIGLRAACLARRATVDAVTRQAFAFRLAEVALDLIGAAPHFADPIVSLYQPIRGEAETAPLLVALAGRGYATAMPRTLGRGTPLTFHAWRPDDPLAAGAWGIPEPLPGAPVVEPDVLLVPLAAFDRHGGRLGYGAGFYDGALFHLRAKKRVLAIGVGFSVQEVGRVPCEPHDQRLDAVITETETLDMGAV